MVCISPLQFFTKLIRPDLPPHPPTHQPIPPPHPTQVSHYPQWASSPNEAEPGRHQAEGEEEEEAAVAAAVQASVDGAVDGASQAVEEEMRVPALRA